MKLFYAILFPLCFALDSSAQSCIWTTESGENWQTPSGENWQTENCENISPPSVVTLFPNPTTDFFQVKGLDENTEGVLFNALGQYIKKVNLNTEVNVSDYPNGIYFLKIKNKLLKFIKQ